MSDHPLYKNDFDNCPLTFAMNLIGGKWRLPIIWALSQNGTMRYGELKKHIHGITNMMLAQTLKELEAYCLIDRKQYAEVPPRVEYSLTSYGMDLIPPLKALAHWGKAVRSEFVSKNSEFESEESAGQTLA